MEYVEQVAKVGRLVDAPLLFLEHLSFIVIWAMHCISPMKWKVRRGSRYETVTLDGDHLT